MVKKLKYNSHYDWLNANLPTIFEKLGLKWDNYAGIVVAHGDKAYGYNNVNGAIDNEWEGCI